MTLLEQYAERQAMLAKQGESFAALLVFMRSLSPEDSQTLMDACASSLRERAPEVLEELLALNASVGDPFGVATLFSRDESEAS
jgi:hypothetical protein